MKDEQVLEVIQKTEILGERIKMYGTMRSSLFLSSEDAATLLSKIQELEVA